MYTCDGLYSLPTGWDLEFPRRQASRNIHEGLSRLRSTFENVYEKFYCPFDYEPSL